MKNQKRKSGNSREHQLLDKGSPARDGLEKSFPWRTVVQLLDYRGGRRNALGALRIGREDFIDWLEHTGFH